jgi:hypothetical protein
MFMIQGLTTNSSDSFLLADNYPSWLAYKSEGPSVLFQVPEDSDRYMKGITLCVLYSSTHENLATECLPSVLIINYTKFTNQIYKRDIVMSFNDEDWQNVSSNLGVGDNVEIFIAIGHGFAVKEMVVYLIYDQSNDIEPVVKMEPLAEVEVQPSPDVKMIPSPVVKMDLSADVEVCQMEPSLVVKNEPLPKRQRQIEKYLQDFATRVIECLCLNQK